MPDKKEISSIIQELGGSVVSSADTAVKLIRGRNSATAARSRVNRIIIVEDTSLRKKSDGSKEKAGGLGSTTLLNEVNNVMGDGSSYVRVCGHSWLFDAISVFSAKLPFTEYPPENAAVKGLWEIGNLYDAPVLL